MLLSWQRKFYEKRSWQPREVALTAKTHSDEGYKDTFKKRCMNPKIYLWICEVLKHRFLKFHKDSIISSLVRIQRQAIRTQLFLVTLNMGIGVCLLVCLTDHNSWTSGRICLKSREKHGNVLNFSFELLSWVGRFYLKKLVPR